MHRPVHHNPDRQHGRVLFLALPRRLPSVLYLTNARGPGSLNPHVAARHALHDGRPRLQLSHLDIRVRGPQILGCTCAYWSFLLQLSDTKGSYFCFYDSPNL